MGNRRPRTLVGKMSALARTRGLLLYVTYAAACEVAAEGDRRIVELRTELETEKERTRPWLKRRRPRGRS